MNVAPLQASCIEEIEQLINGFLWSAVPIDFILSVVDGEDPLSYRDEDAPVIYRKQNAKLVDSLQAVQKLVQTYTDKAVLEIIKDVADGHPMICESDICRIECLLGRHSSAKAGFGSDRS